MTLRELMRKINGTTQLKVVGYCDYSKVYLTGTLNQNNRTELTEDYEEYCKVLDREVAKINVYDGVLVLEV